MTNELPGQDLESRAALYRVVRAGAALRHELDALPEAARARIGLADEDLDRIERIFSHSLWASTADLNQRGEDQLSQYVIELARLPEVGGLAEVQLVTNDVELSGKFWRAVWPTAEVECETGHLRITPRVGPTLRFSEAIVAGAITTIDMRVVVDVGAADRLRAAGFEVAHDGAQAVDVNAMDATIHFEVPGDDQR